jgi:acyl transferase domain-containing protein
MASASVFDHRTNGYGRGEGVGTVIVKALSAALEYGNTVRAIVRGPGSNQDGKTPGISLPNPEAQEALIKQVYASAGLDVLETGYIEAHGTGTPVGDPLEMQAIANAFRIAEREWPLHIGSVKANLGHLEGGAGIAALIKVILLLEAKIIPGLAN